MLFLRESFPVLVPGKLRGWELGVGGEGKPSPALGGGPSTCVLLPEWLSMGDAQLSFLPRCQGWRGGLGGGVSLPFCHPAGLRHPGLSKWNGVSRPPGVKVPGGQPPLC